MRALVSDQEVFTSVNIGTGPDFTVVSALKLPPGSGLVFATVELGPSLKKAFGHALPALGNRRS